MKWIVKRKFEGPYDWTRKEFNTEAERAAWLEENGWQIKNGDWFTKEANDQIELFTTEEARERAIEIAISMVEMRMEDANRKIAFTKDFLVSELNKREPLGSEIERYGREIREAQELLKVYKEEMSRLELIRDYEG